MQPELNCGGGQSLRGPRWADRSASVINSAASHLRLEQQRACTERLMYCCREGQVRKDPGWDFSRAFGCCYGISWPKCCWSTWFYGWWCFKPWVWGFRILVEKVFLCKGWCDLVGIALVCSPGQVAVCWVMVPNLPGDHRLLVVALCSHLLLGTVWLRWLWALQVALRYNFSRPHTGTEAFPGNCLKQSQREFW